MDSSAGGYLGSTTIGRGWSDRVLDWSHGPVSGL
jgi:hypothetical protein